MAYHHAMIDLATGYAGHFPIPDVHPSRDLIVRHSSATEVHAAPRFAGVRPWACASAGTSAGSSAPRSLRVSTPSA
jgi:hypothetical protein